MKIKSWLYILLAALFISACGAEKSVVQNMLEKAKKGKDTSEFWVGGVAKQKLYNVMEYEILSSRPLAEEIRQYAPKVIEASERRFTKLCELMESYTEATKLSNNHTEVRRILNDMTINSMPDEFFLNSMPELIGSQKNNIDKLNQDMADLEDFARKPKGVAYKVRIHSTNKGGQPIIVIWTITVVKLNNKFKVSYLYNDESLGEGKDASAMYAVLQLIVGKY